ncbi:S41 family peptidase [Tenacibaculum caenipelagi]|uniref:Peptidase S41-like protein n=1 Tax=Tenacibaculum caenipelagi TaxID=1325435 RepID=A0A4R6TCH8_9FLAO|nr:S41 family peptidase [Tenacibaculum caenipelagi]TDQ25474.1 peptidase S41-like protein [Tenacibaculum caenipelagi]
MKLLKLSLIALFSILIISCSEKDNAPKNIEVQNFVWKGLNAYYLWQDLVPDLADSRFSNDNEVYSYLSGYDNPANLFYNLLYMPNEYPKDPDRTYSWIVDDYIALEQAFAGIRLTSGMKLEGADYANGSGGYYVYVYDVVNGSDANTQGVTRGMIITEVNGTTLTRANVNDLFANNTLTIHLADYNGGNPVSNGTTITVTKSQVTENPVKVSNVITDGSHTIGYLLYNQFSSDFDGDLNAEFANFKTAGITDLIIDLRYNGGGSVQTAAYLGSMITGQYTGELFAKQIWNHKVMEVTNPDLLINNFTDQILNKNSQGNVVLNEVINSLNLNTVYFIVSDGTASASELVINALKAYIDVKLVGIQTYGKHVGSITLYDSDDYTRNGSNLKSHTWAMQPIVLEIQNKNGENAPEGFIPEVIMEEDPGNLGILGDPTEPLLERTIQYITTGAKGIPTMKKGIQFSPSWNSDMMRPDYNNMYVELK